MRPRYRVSSETAPDAAGPREPVVEVLASWTSWSSASWSSVVVVVGVVVVVVLVVVVFVGAPAPLTTP